VKASEEMYINGYLRSNFRKDEALSRLLHILGECFHGNLRHGFEFKSKYPNTFDLRPIVYEYDDVFIDILIDNEIPELIYSATQKDLCLTHIQLRKAMKGHSYMDWHRDTYYNGAEIIGPLPPSYKIIFYPTHNRSPELRLKILKGSSKCMNLGHMRINLDQELLNLMSIDVIESSDQGFILFDTSSLHGAFTETHDNGSFRLIYTFTPREQFMSKYESMPEHRGVSNIFDSRRDI
tara:strand:+ start:1535 stop:2242 length:708 start_codon:yes stop_codon:yes gene_type:complete